MQFDIDLIEKVYNDFVNVYINMQVHLFLTKLAGHNVCVGKSQGGHENEKMDVRLRAGNTGDG